MLKTKPFICGDFGAGTLKLAEFEPTDGGSLRLLRYSVKALGLEGSKESTRHATLLAAILEALEEGGFVSRDINVCAAGYSVFSKFVKLPAVETAKVTQIIQYEAQQNVPFPLDDVVWDHQILGHTASGELEVLLVAIKSDIVEGLFALTGEAGLKMKLVDVSPAALCNTFRFNYGGEEGCTMLLDIGAKTSNVLFFEQDRVFSRSINIGANAITQDFANEVGISFDEAEALKIEVGFVSLGGAYEEPDDPNQAAISKISRQVMTRLHIQMNQTIQFYRGQQGGSAPQRLYLAGGASIMPYASQFFAEKLNLPVDYLNPFANIEIDESVDLEWLASTAHLMSEVVGLGIRNLATCPVNLNLMPQSHQRREAFKQKQPYFIAAVLALILVVFAYGFSFDRAAAAKRSKIAEMNETVNPLRTKQSQLVSAREALLADYQLANQFVGLIDSRIYWTRFLGELRGAFIAFEKEFKLGETDSAGVWIESLSPVIPAAGGQERGARASRFGSANATNRVAASGPVDIYYLQATCRAVNLLHRSPSANTDFAYALEKTLKTNQLFGAEYTKLMKIDQGQEEDLTFTFDLQLQMAQGITLY